MNQTEKRLALIKRGDSLFPRNITRLVKAETLINMATAEGPGDTSPATLDHTRISALKQTDCRNPKWVHLECSHGNPSAKEIRCRKCEGCRHVWRKKVRFLIGDGCRGRTTWFVTLTFREYPSEIEGEIYDWAQERWHAFLRLAAKEGLDFQYLRVVELQKRGTPHFHLAVNRVRVHSIPVHNTAEIELIVRSLAMRSGFGDQLWVEKARLGGKGVASYLSKYLSKSEVWEMARSDGRAIRRYSRSQTWCLSDRKERVWRFRRVGRVQREAITEADLPCVCGEGFVLNQMVQASRWLGLIRDRNTWCAPLDVFDFIHAQNGIEGGC